MLGVKILPLVAVLWATLAYAVISTETTRNEYVGNGSTAIFAYGFRILDADSIDVYDAGVLQVRGADYTVSNVGVESGGNITFTTPPLNLASIILLRDEPYDQLDDISGGAWSSMAAAEDSLDKTTMQIQQLVEQAGRAATVPATSLLGPIVLPDGSTNANEYIKWNAAGTQLDASPITATGDLTLTSYTTATLPAICTENELAIVSDGDMAGTIVHCDTANTWRCPLDTGHAPKMDPLCPPFNATIADTNSGPELQALMDEYEAHVAAGKRPWIFIPGGIQLTTTEKITFTSEGSSSALFYIFSPGKSVLNCNYADTATGTADGCLVITSSLGGSNNQIIIENFGFKGGGVSPDLLLNLNGGAQVALKNVDFRDFDLYGVKMHLSQHVVIDGGICTENSVHDALGACYYSENSNSDIKISNVGFEAQANSNLSFAYLNLSAQSRISITNNAATDAEYFVRMRGDSAGYLVNAIIANNIVQRLGAACIDIAHTPASSSNHHIVIANNTCTSDTALTGIGILLNDTEKAIITGNVLQGFSQGIQISDVNSNLTINDNEIQDVQYGYRVSGTYDHISISGGHVIASISVLRADATSAGGNIFRDVGLGDAATKALADPYDLNVGGWNHATDRIEYKANWVGEDVSFRNGLVISNGTDTEHDLDVTKGQAQSVDGSHTITLAGDMTKQLDVIWAAGDDAGGLGMPDLVGTQILTFDKSANPDTITANGGTPFAVCNANAVETGTVVITDSASNDGAREIASCTDTVLTLADGALGADETSSTAEIRYIEPNTWYHFFLIEGGGTVDACIDTAVNTTNCRTAANYDQYRLIRSVLTGATANILEIE